MTSFWGPAPHQTTGSGGVPLNENGCRRFVAMHHGCKVTAGSAYGCGSFTNLYMLWFAVYENLYMLWFVNLNPPFPSPCSRFIFSCLSQRLFLSLSQPLSFSTRPPPLLLLLWPLFLFFSLVHLLFLTFSPPFPCFLGKGTRWKHHDHHHHQHKR